MNERLSRRARPYPGTIADLKAYVLYYPETGDIITDSRYQTKTLARISQGYPMVYLPIPDGDTPTKGYFRADHVAWAMVDLQWPEGWIVQLNGLRGDLRLSNLVHVDLDKRRWWHMADGTKVEVTKETIRTEDGGNVVVRPLLIGEPKGHDMDADEVAKFGEEWGVDEELDEQLQSITDEVAGTAEQDTESPADLPEVSGAE